MPFITLISDVTGAALSFDPAVSPLPTDLLDCTAQIITGHVRANKVAPEQLAELITAVHRALASLGRPEAQPEATTRPEPAVSIRRSVTREYIVCLECGMKSKVLKRHLGTEHGLSPAAYRERWDLPHDYPLIAPSYSEKRSGLAKQIGLGRKADTPQEEAAPAPPSPARGRGRSPKGTSLE